MNRDKLKREYKQANKEYGFLKGHQMRRFVCNRGSKVI
jgi:hypothetical protein